VIDGSTIQVQTFGRVRLLGIEVPKPGGTRDAFAVAAREGRDRLTRLVLHRWVRLEHDCLPGLKTRPTSSSRTSSSRTACSHSAYVHTEDGQLVNVVMVREGLARVISRSTLTRLDELRRAEDEAKVFRRGIWRLATLGEPQGRPQRRRRASDRKLQD
jgi:endonuclease YncB( thermonuclease family)